MKKILSILLAVCFLLSVTAAVVSAQSSAKMQFSESKKAELIGYMTKYYSAKNVEIVFVDSGTGGLIINYYIAKAPAKTTLSNDVANILILAKSLAKESGIPNPDVSVCPMLMDETPLGIGNYYATSGTTNIDIT